MHPQSHTSPATRDSKQAKLKLTGPVLSPQRSNNGVLQVTLTAKRSMQKHKEMMRVIEVSKRRVGQVVFYSLQVLTA